MPTTSTIVTTKRALVDLLLSRPALDGVQVTYADPGDKAKATQLWLGEVREASQEPVSIKAGRKKRDETYDLDVIADAIKPTPETAEARCLELVAEVEDVVADFDIGVDGVWSVGVTDFRMKSTHAETGTLARAVVTLTVRARLT